MKISINTSINAIDKESWNKLLEDNNPFIRHEFLHALEKHGCVGEKWGWQACHIAIYDDAELLIGAMPLYQKTNSYGEFVFDNAWANAYQQSGLEYYPKLVTSIPYTPAMGQRLLYTSTHSQYPDDYICKTLIKAAQSIAVEHQMSGWHCLFPSIKERSLLHSNNLLSRNDCQFHWHNDSYQNFDEFLNQLRLKKRKNIRQERKRVQSENIKIRVLDGNSASSQDWDQFDLFYQRTFLEKYGHPTLNAGFFKDIAKNLPEQVVLVLADKPINDEQYECIAGALMYRSDTTLYGRHWGCTDEVDSLHFEVCYYQGIEYCIKNNLKIFEPGAQGEHKVARGFLPTLTESFHWLNDSPYQESIENYVQHEKTSVKHYIKSIPSPYKSE